MNKKRKYYNPTHLSSLPQTKSMASNPNKSDRAKLIPNEATTSKIRPSSSRRSDSFSSHSSNSSLGSSTTFFPEDSPIFSPTTPLRSSGVPFSWEKLPGIPKKQSSKKMMMNPSSMNLLPLPPSGNPKQVIPQVFKKFSTSESFKKDPFFAALVECSKDEQDAMANYWKGSKATMRSSISDRFGFISIYTSCKRTCAVSESIVYLPRSSPHYLYNRR